MTQERLKLYTIDPDYIRSLAAVDACVTSLCPDPDMKPVPFAGVIACGTQSYCVPLMSPRPKYEGMNNRTDFTKIVLGGQLYGVLNFNNMIPVDTSVLTHLNLQASPADTPEDLRYKELLIKEQAFCRQNRDKLVRKANRLYSLLTAGSADTLAGRCCSFSRLEDVLEKRHL